ncbi:MAG: universal stress protein [Bacteroidia bacterium]|nr:universal stress protein [Bacteroidia bacterium]
MNKILVPTDFSECANSAVNIALDLAQKANAEIHFLHVICTPVNWVKLPLGKEKLYPDTLAKINKAKFELNGITKRARDMGLNASEFLTFDQNQSQILNHIEGHSHDFIVMGSNGTSGLREILGSNTQKLVRLSKVPVLVVKGVHDELKINDIVFASNFKQDVHEPFKKVVELAELMQAKIHLLFVNRPSQFEESDESLARMSEFLNNCPEGICTINVFNSLNEERGILKFAKSIHSNLIAITTHGRTGFMKVITPSITESLVNHSNIPVLCVNLHH